MRLPPIARTAFAMLPVLSGPAAAAVWNVVPDGTGDAPTIQLAVSLAADGDTILLAPGTYTGLGNRSVVLGGKELIVTSSGGAAVTIIDCEGASRAFLCLAGETPATVISDLTIRNGNSGATSGGAIFCSNAVPTISGCVFENNVATEAPGGAVHVTGPGQSVLITGCTFTSNRVTGGIIDGGAVSIALGSAEIVDCTFIGNEANQDGAGVFAEDVDEIVLRGCLFDSNFGGGAWLEAVTSSTVEDCQFLNTAYSGGLNLQRGAAGATTRVSDCVFVGNHGFRGGGLATNVQGTVERCLFRENTASHGAALHVYSLVDVRVEQCTIVDNVASGRGGARS